MRNLGDKLIGDINSPIAKLEWLVSFGSPININVATTKQNFGNIYYEDKDLNVSRIAESVDLEKRSYKLNSVTIRLSNYNINGSRISDKLAYGVGSQVSVYLKSQSCESLSDCCQVATLKITRIDHDSDSVRIQAEDINFNIFHRDLPEPKSYSPLQKSINTFDNYDQKVIPMLYGHLPIAPAVIYVEDMTNLDDNSEFTYYERDGIKVIPDISYFDQDREIKGIKQFRQYQYPLAVDDTTEPEPIEKLGLWNNDTLQVEMGDRTVTIPCLPHKGTSLWPGETQEYEGEDIYRYHRFAQYDMDLTHLTLKSSSPDDEDDQFARNLFSSSAAWVSSVQTPISKTSATLYIGNTYFIIGSHKGAFNWTIPSNDNIVNLGSEYFNQEMDDYWAPGIDVPTDYTSENWANFYTHNVGLIKYTFETISGIDKYEGLDTWGNETPLIHDCMLIGSFNYDFELKLLSDFGADNLPKLFRGVTFDSIIYAEGRNSYENIKRQLGLPSFRLEQIANAEWVGSPTEIAFHSIQWDEWDYKYFDNRIDFGTVDDTIIGSITPRTSSFFNEGKYNEDNYSQQSTVRRVDNENSAAAHPALPMEHATTYLTHRNPGQAANQSGYNLDDIFSELVAYDYFNTKDYEFDVTINEQNVGLRQTWAQADIFKNNFFVHARGRIGNAIGSNVTLENENVDRVQSERRKITVDFMYPDIIQKENPSDDAFLLFERLIREEQYKSFESKAPYQLMLKCYYLPEYANPQGSQYALDNVVKFYAYNLDMENIQSFSTAGSQRVYRCTLTADIVQLESSSASEDQFSGFRDNANSELIYGAINYNALVPTKIDSIIERVVDNWAEYNDWNPDAGDSADYDNCVCQARLFQDKLSESMGLNYKLLENPSEILRDILQNELEVPVERIDDQKFIEAFKESKYQKMAFSINEKIESKKLIEEICRQTNFVFKNSMTSGQGTIIPIKYKYTNADVDAVMDPNKFLNFSFNQSKIEETCIGGVIVNYGTNYVNNEFIGQTPLLRHGSSDQWSSLYGIDNLDNFILEFDAPYINEFNQAMLFRDFLYEYGRSPRLNVMFDLPLKDGLDLEVGDVIRFSENPNGVKPYGKDITLQYENLLQKVYPYFLIKKVSIKLDMVSVEAVQLHEITENAPYDFAGTGDVNFDGNTDVLDAVAMVTYVLGNTDFTESQLLAADINLDGQVNVQDIVVAVQNILGDDTDSGGDDDPVVDEFSTIIGDVTNDGNATEQDLNKIWLYVLQQNGGTPPVAPPTFNIPQQLTNADVNQDGVISFKDVIDFASISSDGTSVPGYYQLGVPGDIDGDGVVTLHDVQILEAHLNQEYVLTEPYINQADYLENGNLLLGLEQMKIDLGLADFIPGDINGDGVADQQDFILLYKHIYEGLPLTDEQLAIAANFGDQVSPSGLPQIYNLWAYIYPYFPLVAVPGDWNGDGQFNVEDVYPFWQYEGLGDPTFDNNIDALFASTGNNLLQSLANVWWFHWNNGTDFTWFNPKISAGDLDAYCYNLTGESAYYDFIEGDDSTLPTPSSNVVLYDTSNVTTLNSPYEYPLPEYLHPRPGAAQTDWSFGAINIQGGGDVPYLLFWFFPDSEVIPLGEGIVEDNIFVTEGKTARQLGSWQPGGEEIYNKEDGHTRYAIGWVEWESQYDEEGDWIGSYNVSQNLVYIEITLKDGVTEDMIDSETGWGTGGNGTITQKEQYDFLMQWVSGCIYPTINLYSFITMETLWLKGAQNEVNGVSYPRKMYGTMNNVENSLGFNWIFTDTIQDENGNTAYTPTNILTRTGLGDFIDIKIYAADNYWLNNPANQTSGGGGGGIES